MADKPIINLNHNLSEAPLWNQTIASTPKITVGLQPILKWPGGKERELKYIIPYAPTFRRYFEPFVGGGSVFMAVSAEEYHINDFSDELMALYYCISTGDKHFYEYAESIDKSWENASVFFERNYWQLVHIYHEYREKKISKDCLRNVIRDFCASVGTSVDVIINQGLPKESDVLKVEMENNLYRKMVRMDELEKKKHPLPEIDVAENIKTAVKSAVYMYFRHLYNQCVSVPYYSLSSALFLFIRNYAYSGMFRYSSNGGFNVPYGGMAYNRKSMKKKLDYYRSESLLAHFADTRLYNLDFESFLDRTAPGPDDFVFLDPPYDSEFSTYSKKVFTHSDHERLAHCIINKCRAKWMMIIKNTNFIYNLYSGYPNLKIRMFDKEYVVSFMNRNDKKVTHLLITNY